MKRILIAAIALLCTMTLFAQEYPARQYRESHARKQKAVFDAIHGEIRAQDAISRFQLSQDAATKATVEPHTINSLVLLVEFPDCGFSFQDIETKMSDMLNSPNYTYNSAKGSVKKYLEDQFGGDAFFNFDVVKAPVLSKNRSYYGENGDDDFDAHVPEMVEEALRSIDAEVDFSKYANSSKEVPMVFVFYAGVSEINPVSGKDEYIWPHSHVVSHNFKLDGVKISTYACSSELEYDYLKRKNALAQIGTFCHEFSHTLGLWDYYDTDYELSGGTSAALWTSTSLMDSGSYNDNSRTPAGYNAVDFFSIAFLSSVVSTSTVFEPIVAGRHYSLEPIVQGKRCLYLANSAMDEIYLFECRKADFWDAHIGGSGLLVYHVDFSNNSTGASDVYNINNMTAEMRWQYNEINCRPEFQCVDLIEADGRKDANVLNTYDIAGVFFPTSKVNTLSCETCQAMNFRGGGYPAVGLRNISYDSTTGVVSFDTYAVDGGVTLSLPKVDVQSLSQEIFQSTAVISFCPEDLPDGNATKFDAKISYSVYTSSSQKKTVTVKASPDGRYYVRLDGLSPRTTYTADIYFEDQQGNVGQMQNIRFLTKSPGNFGPYIDFSDANLKDGAFAIDSFAALSVANIPSGRIVRAIDYYFDSAPLEFVKGKMQITSSGLLRVEISYEDGDKDVIIKYIKIR